MGVFIKSAGILLFGFFLLTLQSAVTNPIGTPTFAPNLILPIIIFLGVSPDVNLARGAVIAFLLGYLLDLFCGNLMSMQTFLTVATYVLARGAGLRLFLRGPSFQVLLTFVVALLTSGAMLAIRVILVSRDAKDAAAVIGDPSTVWLAVLGSSLTTALASPLIFVIVRRIEMLSAHRREENTAGS